MSVIRQLWGTLRAVVSATPSQKGDLGCDVTTGRWYLWTTASKAIEHEGNKGIANGYAGLGAGGYVPTGQLGGGTADATTFLRGDQTWVAASGSGAPTDATYVTLSTNGTLTNERVLTGTANRVTVTDAGAGSTVTLDVGSNVYTVGGTDVAVADGGTGASTAASARLNLGLATPPIFGSGRDGTLAFDGATVVPGYTRVSTTYTADRDVFGTNATISAGITVKPAGYRLGLTGTLTIIATGAIQANGNAASGITAGSGGASGGPGTLHAASANGANGRSTVGAGSGGGSVSHAIGGAGGNGGAAAGGSPAGGGGGSVTAPTAAQGDLRDPPYLAWGQLANTGGTGWQSADTGGGGGAGGHDGVSGNSGGGGGSGGALWLACDTIDNAGSITANGGNGGAATGTDNGGGGGGGGGWILLVYRATSGSGLGTVTATKGTGGAGSGGGASGANGSDGVAYTLQLT